MKDENYKAFVRGQMDAIEDITHELTSGSRTDSVIEKLRQKAAANPTSTDRNDGKYGTGYGLILSIATFVSSLREVVKR